MSYEHRDDSVLVFVRAQGIRSPGWAWFGIHEPDDPSYAGSGWNEPFSSLETGNPAWPGDVLKVAWSAPLLAPDGCAAVAPTPLEINALRLPWLQHHARDAGICAGTPLSAFCCRIAEIGGDVYVPLIGVQDADWKRWSEMRATVDRAGGYA
jgi:hypothetical protein